MAGIDDTIEQASEYFPMICIPVGDDYELDIPIDNFRSLCIRIKDAHRITPVNDDFTLTHVDDG